MKLQITKEDFDNAVKQPWSTETCVAAQFGIRHGLSLTGSANVPENSIYRLFRPQDALMRTFDYYFKNPGDEGKPELQKLRDSLPMDVRIPVGFPVEGC